MGKKGIYALYKGDEFIDIGTKEYLAKILNCKPAFIGYLSTPANKRRIDKRKKSTNALITVKVGNEGDSDD